MPCHGLSGVRTRLAIIAGIPGWVNPGLAIKNGGFQVFFKQVAYLFVCNQGHAAVGMVDNKPFQRTEEFMRDNQRAYSIFSGTPARIAQNMGFAVH